MTSALLIGHVRHPGTGPLRRQEFDIPVTTRAHGRDPAAWWRVEAGACVVPGCKRAHDALPAAFREVRAGEITRAVAIESFASPLPDEADEYPGTPRTVRVAL